MRMISDRAVLTVARHEGAWVVELEGELFGRSFDREIAKAAANRRARQISDAGRACQVRVSGEHGYFRRFYVRRVLRIMPLYFAVIIVWAFLYDDAGSYFLLSSVFGANLSELFHIHEPHGPGVLWSLAVDTSPSCVLEMFTKRGPPRTLRLCVSG